MYIPLALPMRFWLGEVIIWLYGDWPSTFLTQRRNKAYIQPSLSNWFGLQRTLYIIKEQKIFSCETKQLIPRGLDRPALPVWIANQIIAGFASPCHS